ncbi:MAG TPA: hypothetical protein DC014_02815 [Treponema sp.]|nr:hypothetical protein [Treponema sp.]
MDILAVEQLITNFSVFLSVLCLVIAVMQPASPEQKLIMSYAVFSLVTCIGYLGIVYSESSLRLLVYATKCKYIGSLSVSITFILLLRYLHIHVPKWLYGLFGIVLVFLMMQILTFDSPALARLSDPCSWFAFMRRWMFKDYYAEVIHGIPYLHKVNNWGHYLYVGFLLSYMIIYTIIHIRTIRHNLSVDIPNLSFLYIIIMLPALCYLAEKIFIQAIGYEAVPLVPIGFDISNIMFLYLIYGRKFCNVDALANPAVFDAISTPAFVLDSRYRITNINKKAFEVFTEVTEEEIGKHLFEAVDQMNVPIIDAMLKVGTQVDAENEYIMVGDNAFHPRIRMLGPKRNPQGYVIWLEDVTLLHDYKQNLEFEVAKKTEELQFTADKMRAMRDQMVIGFSAIAERHDLSSKGHLRRTANYTEAIAFELMIEKKFPEQIDFSYVERMAQIAPLHDIGKIYIDRAILNKMGKLTDEERRIMERHTIMGAQFIDKTMKENVDQQYVQMAKDVACAHHEWWDGTGYPNHLCGNAIPLCARIMAVADVFDALVTERPYKKAFSVSEAYDIIRKGSGSHFDPRIVDAFEAIRSQVEEIQMVVDDNSSI